MAGLPNIAATLGGWSARHRLVAISGWLVLVIGLTLLGSAVGQVTMTAPAQLSPRSRPYQPTP